MTITHEQLELRRKYLGASDVAAVLGAHPYRSAADVRLEKLGLLEDLDLSDEEAVDVGNDSEPYTVGWAAKKIGRAYASTQRSYVASNGVMIAHPDGVLLDPDEPIEAKYSGRTDEWGEPGEQRVPQQHYIQLLSQMICMKSEAPVERGHIAAFLPTWKNRRRLYTFPWAGPTADAIEKHCVEWWDRHIRRQEPCDTAPSLEVAKRIRFAGLGTSAPVDPANAARLLAAREAKKTAEAEYEASSAAILAELAGAEVGECDGYVITHPVIQRKGYVVEAGEYRRLNVKESK